MTEKNEQLEAGLASDLNNELDTISDDMPCGCCDMGVYSEMAMLNRTAREFSVLTTKQRQNSLPKCKKYSRNCVGAKHFSEAITQIDGV